MVAPHQALAAVVERPGEPFAIRSIGIGDLRDEEILVSVVGVGICHTDVVAQHGAFGLSGPAVLGHEGSGIILHVGRNVSGFAAGDRVVISFRSCGDCRQCHAGRSSYCETMPALNYAGRRLDGSTALTLDGIPVAGNFFGQSSFATLAVTYARNLVPVADDVPLALMGPLGCGIQTGVGAVMRSMACEPGSTIVIAGGGAVGLSAVMGAVISQCAGIILIEPHESRRALALDYGATEVVDPSAEPVPSALARLAPSGVDYALDTTGRADVLAALIGALAPRGLLGLVGIAPPDTNVPADVNRLMASGHRIMGIIEGDSDPATFIPELIGYYRAGKLPFDRMIRTYPLSQINEAVRDQAEGLVVKAVLLPGDGTLSGENQG
ncbi:NAD(P)-dependent alcohol dehydrogenase [Sphingobium lactosutens]|uniref:NAD(P)-dependent alcohol dehydrogenase n=1 Tax=Sphingobium lactosutens TaxID=522773 RepID=UPI0015BFF934|nr:NAD(P)-dependent alcohol dehydrogenase [Sphingobium lactosutens]NWK96250.1 NAD(P)-dependent alcohol dehydrogenase [Sphingobium lactosutens]